MPEVCLVKVRTPLPGAVAPSRKCWRRTNGSQRSRVAPVVWDTANAVAGSTGTVIEDSTTGMRPRYVSDPSGSGRELADHPVEARVAIARFLLGVLDRQPDLTVHDELVNGEPGLVATDSHDRTLAVVTLVTTGSGAIRNVWAVRNPEKLHLWGPGPRGAQR